MRLMTDYVDGVLGGVRSGRVRDHLEQCEPCREEEDRARLVVDCLEKVPEVPAPEDGLHRIETRLAFLPPSPAVAPAGRLRTLVLPYCAGLATAAAILLLVLPMFSAVQSGASPAVDRPAANGTATATPALLPGEKALTETSDYQFIDRHGNLIELPPESRRKLLHLMNRRTDRGSGIAQPVDYEER